MTKKKRIYKKHTVTARVQILDLTKAGSSMELEIFANQEKIGTVIIGRGSLTWRGGKKKRDKRVTWSEFAEMMDKLSYGG
jgi:acetyl-CoA carboxylase carboxyltransferase component